MPSEKTQTTGRTLKGMILPIFAGLCLSQAVASIAVYFSNQHIRSTAQALETAGYLSIPTGPATQTLTQLGTALGGGLFFSLSIGAGLALVAWAAIYLWDQQFGRHRKWLMAYWAAWLLLLIWINSAGLAWLPSLLVLIVPTATARVAAWGLAPKNTPKSRYRTAPAIALAILTVLWATQFNQDMFVTIRDHILLSNPVGQKVNDFYYRYTLYAAQVFKSFHQKTIRTYRWNNEISPALKQNIEKRLWRHDVLPLAGPKPPDVFLSQRQEKLVMTSRDGRSLEIAPAQFITDTSAWLKRYSRRTDRLAPFRRVTRYGLLIGFPILLFFMIYGAWRIIMGLIMKEDRANLAASAICLTLGILLFLPMLRAGPGQFTRDNLAAALETDSWPVRVAALRYIERRKIDISGYPQYKTLMDSPLAVERYWLARSMTSSRSISTYTQLKTLIKDPHPNVVCQAYYALGQRRTPSAIPSIRRQLKTSDHWYTQWYGYRAIRRLGWQQKPSK